MFEQDTINHMLIFMLLGVIPLLIVISTAFAKTAIVLAILKNAFGGVGVPPLAVITGLALVITIFIMSPVASDMADIAQTIHKNSEETTTANSNSILPIKEIKKIAQPLVKFLTNNTPKQELEFFQNLTKNKKDSLSVLLISFASNELKEAIILGALLFLPFILIDLLTATTLVSLGIGNIPAISISLPLKLILFVAADGFHLLVKALVMSYN